MNAHVTPPGFDDADPLSEIDRIEVMADPTPADLALLDAIAGHSDSFIASSARVARNMLRLRARQVAAGPTESDPSLRELAVAVAAGKGAVHHTDPFSLAGGGDEAPVAVDPIPDALPSTPDQAITRLATSVAKYVMELRAMVDGRFVSYLRVSTARQGASGLGLEAQRKAVGDFLAGGRWSHVREFVEIESGKRDDRPKLTEAMALCRLHGAVLIIAKLDRLSRDAHFLLGLQKAGVRFVAADMPEANEMVVGIMAVVAQAERKMISTRTKAALAAAKARGTRLGGDRGNFAVIADRGRAAGRAARQERATARAADIRPIIADLQAEGVTSLAQLAAALTERGIPTSRGADRWSPMQVSRVLKAGAYGT